MHTAAQVVCDLKPYDHVTPTPKALRWLPVKQRIEFKLCLLVHLVINKREPVYVQNLLTTTASMFGRASNRSANHNDLVKQSTRLKLGDRVFSVAGPRVCNQLPTDLKTMARQPVFPRWQHRLYSIYCIVLYIVTKPLPTSERL